MIKSVFALTALLCPCPQAALQVHTLTSKPTLVGLVLTTLCCHRFPCRRHEGPLGENGSYYVQGGIAVVTPDGGDTDTVPSGKAGLGFGSVRRWEYGEVSFIGSGDDDIDKVMAVRSV